MKWYKGAFVACTLPVVAGLMAREASSGSPQSDARRAVLQLQEQSITAALKRDVPFFERALAENFVNITAGGNRQTKRQVLDDYRLGDLRVRNLEVDDLEVRVYGETAVLTGIAAIHGRLDEKNFRGQGRFTRIFTRTAGGWRIVSHQTTPMSIQRLGLLDRADREDRQDREE